jgi:hypothetical protein
VYNVDMDDTCRSLDGGIPPGEGSDDGTADARLPFPFTAPLLLLAAAPGEPPLPACCASRGEAGGEVEAAEEREEVLPACRTPEEMRFSSPILAAGGCAGLVECAMMYVYTRSCG